MKNAARKQTKPKCVSGTGWAKFRKGYWDRPGFEVRNGQVIRR